MKQIFTVSEAARELNKSAALIYKLIQRGDISTLRDKPPLLISGVELEKERARKRRPGRPLPIRDSNGGE